jgi:D-alanyl-lipoteichoic acid acyltransferase DltB (MBOAT superfamily)
MLFPTVTFAIFFLLVFAASWLFMPFFRLWKWFMIAASVVFLWWWGGPGLDLKLFVIPWPVFLLATFTLGNQFFAVLINGSRGLGARKGFLAAALVFDLGILAWFKYYDFFVAQVDDVLDAIRLGTPLGFLNMVLPVGVSFLTFRAITYVVDVYRGREEPAPTLDFALYVCFFPYLMAGPIARASQFLPQLREPRDPRSIDVGRALFLIYAGLLKKMLLADYLAKHLVVGVFLAPGQFTSLETLVAILGYSVQIYCDFSAYSDIAIGISLLLGFELPDNFNAPYTARTLQDFWRRWHMTLSSWLRDYLYIPLGGNRKGEGRTYVNIMVTMLLAGLWHGAGWTFVIWGGLHGAGQCVGRARRAGRKARGLPDLPGGALNVARQRAITFAYVTFAWIFFASGSLGAALRVIKQLFVAWGSVGSGVTLTFLLVIAIGIGVQYIPQRLWQNVEASFSRLNPLLQGVAVGVGLFAISVLAPAGPATFLYFRF